MKHRNGWNLLFAGALLVSGCANASPSASGKTSGATGGNNAWEAIICTSGRIEMEGVCCWPGQHKENDACAGTPECPVDWRVEDDTCKPDCKHMQVISDGRCCWPDQTWSKEQDRCTGTPSCPDGTLVSGEACEPDMDILQPGTETVWLKCPLGRTFDGQVCKGQSASMNFKDALSACPEGYRLPTLDEFVTLLGGCDDNVKKKNPGMCSSCREGACYEMFRSDIDCYWSSATFDKEYAWNALFETGRIGWNRRGSEMGVRCVKAAK